MRKFMGIVAVSAAIALAMSSAGAAVTFDSGSGTGFVGKGDIQEAFGLNNKALQDAASTVTFSYLATAEFDVTCEWDSTTGGPKPKTIHHVITNTKTSGIASTVDGDPRKTRGQNQFTGFNLLGHVLESSDSAPEVGDVCRNGNGADSVGYVTAVESLGGGAETLTAHLGTSSAVIWPLEV